MNTTATQLLLLLRESGDDGADAIRRDTLTWYSARLAAIVGNENTETLLRAQVALSLVLGIVMLRRSTNAEPLVSVEEAGGADPPLREAFTALLDPDAAWLWRSSTSSPVTGSPSPAAGREAAAGKGGARGTGRRTADNTRAVPC